MTDTSLQDVGFTDETVFDAIRTTPDLSEAMNVLGIDTRDCVIVSRFASALSRLEASGHVRLEVNPR